MSGHRSAEDVEAQHLAVLGPDLGPIYHALYNEIVWLHAKWLEYRKLYGHSANRIDLLNGTAGFFFKVVQDVLLHDVLLDLSCLTGPMKSAGRPTLTLRRLPPAIPDPVLRATVLQSVEDARLACAFATEWRNRELAHRDLGLALSAGAAPLPGVSRQHVETALLAIRTAFGKVSGHYFDSEVAFDRFVTGTGAEALVYHLAFAQRAEERQEQRLLAGKALPDDLEPIPEV